MHEAVRDREKRLAPLIVDQLWIKRRGQAGLGWPWYVDETYVKVHGNCTIFVDVLSQIQRRVIVLSSNRADIGEPIAVVDIVGTLLLIDKCPCLALISPVV